MLFMKYFIQTFGCQMNYADSEKINMLLLQSGLQKVLDPTRADVVILNTCSVRKKGEDRVYGFAEKIYDFNKENKTNILVGLTGCMARKTGIHEKYYDSSEKKRNAARKITLLKDENSLYNSDDKIFGLTDKFDFVFRIEEVSYLTKILSLIWKREIGNDAKYNDYLQVKQCRDNPASANIIIQTGCDNFCSYCIVPHTRGREISRDPEEILTEIREAATK
jgi:tRNA-2-methylthio-N6-dimethylallyladenosine synthase